MADVTRETLENLAAQLDQLAAELSDEERILLASVIAAGTRSITADDVQGYVSGPHANESIGAPLVKVRAVDFFLKLQSINFSKIVVD